MNSHVPAFEVADRFRGAHGRRAHLRAQRRRQRDRRRLLDDLLMAPLDRALALAEMNRRAVRVGEDLKLDVPRVAQIALEQHRVVAEGRERFALRALERFAETRASDSTTRMPRPPPPALALIKQRKTDTLGMLRAAPQPDWSSPS